MDARNFGTNLGMVFHEVKTFTLALHTLKIARMITYFGEKYFEFFNLDEVIENIHQLETQKQEMLQIPIDNHLLLYHKSGILKIIGIMIDHG